MNLKSMFSPTFKKQAKEAERTDTLMDFPDAIRELIAGKKITRVFWKNSKDYGVLKDNLLCIYRKGNQHIWNVSDGDLKAEDWFVV